jgi:hypothetical protein
MFFNHEHTNKNDFIWDYEQLKELLSEKYGEPNFDNVSWEDDLYKDDKSKWGFAISIGDVRMACSWEIEDTSIRLILHGENYEISFVLMYHGKKYFCQPCQTYFLLL